MQQNYESVNAMAARCVEISDCLRKFLLSGQEMAANARRDVATAANLLEAVSYMLEDVRRDVATAANLLEAIGNKLEARSHWH